MDQDNSASADGVVAVGRPTPGSEVVVLNDGRLGAVRTIGGIDYIATRTGEAGTVVFGPYERRQPGRYRVEFDVALADDVDALGDPIALTIEVTTNRGTAYFVDRRVLRSQLSRDVRTIAVEFAMHVSRVLEYRVSCGGQVGVVVPRSVRLTFLGADLPRPSRRGSAERALENEQEFLDGYLRNVSGVIHVGANYGQERRYYWLLGLDVLWVEPIAEMYDKLVKNTVSYPRQRPVNALLADVDGKEIELQIANNSGASSSILDLQDHAVIFPDVQYVEKRTLVSMTLLTLMERERVSPEDYQALTLDVEGAELLVLRGAEHVLPRFRYVKCEVADFPARTGTPTVPDLDEILRRAGFRELARRAFATGPNNRGTYWDVVWKRVEPGEPFAAPNAPVPMVANPRDVEGLEKWDSDH